MSADSEWIGSLEGRGDSVADGGEDRLEVSAEDEDHTSQFDRIGDENADHDHETVLQLALPRQVCLLCYAVIDGPFLGREEDKGILAVRVDGAESPGAGVRCHVFVVAFVLVDNQEVRVTDPVIACVIGDIFLVPELQEDCVIWV